MKKEPDFHRRTLLECLCIPKGFWYVATPFTKYPGGLEQAYIAACKFTADLTRLNIPAYSPIAHGHSLCIHGGLDPTGHAIWMAIDQPMMEAAHGLIIATLPGWDESIGVAEETQTFAQMKKPYHYIAAESIREG